MPVCKPNAWGLDKLAWGKNNQKGGSRAKGKSTKGEKKKRLVREDILKTTSDGTNLQGYSPNLLISPHEKEVRKSEESVNNMEKDRVVCKLTSSISTNWGN